MRKPNSTNNLAVLCPKLARQWHPTKNGDKRPEDFLPQSTKRVVWQCSINPAHEWEAVIASRHKSGCPHCHNEVHLTSWFVGADGKKRPKTLSDMSVLFSELVAEGQERDKLGALYVGNTRKLTWRCSKDHQSWENQLRKRAVDGQGCPFCANRMTYEGNSLLALNPDIAAQ